MLHRALALFVVIGATGLGAPVSTVSAQDVPRIAVLDFNGFMMGEGGGSIALGKAIADMLVTEFSGREGLQVVERQQIRALLDEQDLQLRGRVEEDEAIEIGKLLGVQYVLLGSVMSIVDQLRMDIRAVDVETSEVLSVLKRTDQTSELFNVVVDLADDFSGELDLIPPSQRPEMEAVPVSATIEFSRAVDFEDRGDIERAIEHYEATLEIYENHRAARRALERLRGS